MYVQVRSDPRETQHEMVEWRSTRGYGRQNRRLLRGALLFFAVVGARMRARIWIREKRETIV